MAKGFQNVTADGVVLSAGAVIALYGIHIVSGGANGVVNIRSGSTVSDTVVLKETGTAQTGKTVNFPNGIVFPSGCYIDIDGNTNSVLVQFEAL